MIGCIPGFFSEESMGTDIYLHVERRHGSSWEYCGELDALEIRHYEFFAILANVKNPIRSTEPFEYIANPRGLPEDMSEDLKKDSLLPTGHDAGWITLRELLNFDWEGKTILRSAVVDPGLAPLFGDGNQRFPSDRITEVYGLANDGPGPRVAWVDSYKEAIGVQFWDDLVKTLIQLGPPDDVRIIFSFDSRGKYHGGRT
jgi:hypothetical protein